MTDMKVLKVEIQGSEGYKSKITVELDDGSVKAIELKTLLPQSLEGTYFPSEDKLMTALEQTVSVIEEVITKEVDDFVVSLIKYRGACVDIATSEKYVTIPGKVPKGMSVTFLSDFKRFILNKTSNSSFVEKEVIPFHKGSAIHCDLVDIMKATFQKYSISHRDGNVVSFEVYEKDDGRAVIESAYYSIRTGQWSYLEDRVFEPSDPHGPIERHFSSIIEKVNKHGFEPDSIEALMTSSCAVMDFKIS